MNELFVSSFWGPPEQGKQEKCSFILLLLWEPQNERKKGLTFAYREEKRGNIVDKGPALICIYIYMYIEI